MADTETEKKPEAAGRKRQLRHRLMLGGVIVVVLGSAWFYLKGGRYIGTDNAYLRAEKILVTPEVTGEIKEVRVTDNQQVHAGDVLAVVDDRHYRIAFEKAAADLAATATRIEEFKASYRQKSESIAQAQIEADFAEKEYKRRISLVSVSETERAEFKQRRDAAVKDVDIQKAELGQIFAQLGGDDKIKAEEHPAYKSAAAMLEDAKLRLEQTQVKAPIDGLINAAPRRGDFARATAPMLTMIGTEKLWMDANFKETQLTNIQPGQPVTIEIDTFPDMELHGKVESISPGTGSEFSILPAQNATGNWVKVVQRVAVHIAIDRPPGDTRLRAGLSGRAVIDTGSYPHLSRKRKEQG
jgi:membrane fusion protein, multidrug efflux system